LGIENFFILNEIGNKNPLYFLELELCTRLGLS
jgi:hypothetical protein